MKRLAVLGAVAALAVCWPVDARSAVSYDSFAVSALVAGARTAGDVGASGGLVTLESGSAWVQADLDSSPSSFVRAAPYEPGPLTRTVAGQVNSSAGQKVLTVPDAEAAFPGEGSGDLGLVPEQSSGPLTISGGAASARASAAAASGTSTGASLELQDLVRVDGSTSAVSLQSTPGSATATARTAVGRVSVQGVLELRDVVATASVSAVGDQHRADAHLSVGSMTVAGQEVGLTDDGLVVANQPVLPGTTIAQATDAANGALAAAGVRVELTAARRHTGPREAAADTGGVRITVTTPDLPGGVAGNRVVVVVGSASLTEEDALAVPTGDTGSSVPPPSATGARPPTTTTTIVPGTPGTPGVQPPTVAAPLALTGYEVLGRRFTGMDALAAFGAWQFLTLASVTLYAFVDRRRRLALEARA